MSWIQWLAVPAFLLFIGYRLGISQDATNRTAEENEAKNDLIRSLNNEITYNEELLGNGFEPDNYGRDAFRYILRTDAYQSTVSSERYQMLNIKTQSTFSDYYSGIHQLNEYTRQLDGEKEARVISRIYNSQTPLHTTLLRATRDLRSLLEKEDA